MHRKLWLIALLFSCPLAASAGTWQVCHLKIQVIKHLPATDTSSRKLQAKVLDVRAVPTDSECPAKDAIITFAPETSNYQYMLPYKRWPKVGQQIKIRYQYMDGICYSGRECRIEHYPVL
jgi:hypothetical protein